MKTLLSLFKRRQNALDLLQTNNDRKLTDPNYISPSQYADIQEYVCLGTPDFSLITDADYAVLLERVMGSGFIDTLRGGWRGIKGESYIISSTGHTPTVNESDDPIEFAQKQFALREVIQHINALYRKGIVQKIKWELEKELKQEIQP